MKQARDPRRRKLLQALGASGAFAAAHRLPDTWVRPAVDTVFVPAHAQLTSPCTGVFCGTAVLVELTGTNHIDITVEGSCTFSGTYDGQGVFNGPPSTLACDVFFNGTVFADCSSVLVRVCTNSECTSVIDSFTALPSNCTSQF